LENVAALRQDVMELTVAETNLKDRIPAELDYPNIMMTVYTMAKNNGLNPKNISYESIAQQGQTVTLGLSFTCTGSRDNIYTLAEQFLKGDEYLFVLDSISVSGSPEESSATMILTAYALQN